MKKLFILFALAAVLPFQSAAAQSADYEAMKETLAHRVVVSYLSAAKQGQENSLNSFMADQKTKVDVMQAGKVAQAFPDQLTYVDIAADMAKKMKPGNEYIVRVNSLDPAQYGSIKLIVVGTADAPLLKVKESLQLVKK